MHNRHFEQNRAGVALEHSITGKKKSIICMSHPRATNNIHLPLINYTWFLFWPSDASCQTVRIGDWWSCLWFVLFKLIIMPKNRGIGLLPPL